MQTHILHHRATLETAGARYVPSSLEEVPTLEPLMASSKGKDVPSPSARDDVCRMGSGPSYRFKRKAESRPYAVGADGSFGQPLKGSRP